jgi:hypothetical protein
MSTWNICPSNDKLVPPCTSKPQSAHQIDGDLFQHARAHPPLDVCAVAALDHQRVDALATQQMREEHAGWPRTDDGDLRAHLSLLSRDLPVARLAGCPDLHGQAMIGSAE